MDMFSKLKSAVSSALPGNPMSKDFDVYGIIASAGPGHLWKVYNGVKKTTKQDAAIFVFEKKCLEKYSKRDREMIVECLKKGASQLTRLRHPKVLSVIQPLEESRESLAFATEPVLASLSNILGYHDNLPEPVVKQLEEHKMFEVEIKYGLLQMTEGLQFLHNDAKLLHSNICPESIIVNKNGAWKLAGFDFCITNKNPPEQAPLFPFRDWDPDLPPCVQPALDYLAPEYAITASCSLASDLFSMGVLIYAVFNSGKPLYECKNQLNSYKKNAEELRKWRGSLLGKIPEELRDIVKLLLNTEPSVRPDPDQLSKVSFFEDVGCMTLQYMDTLFQQDNLQKSQFFKGLPKIIVKFPKRVNLQRILPALLKECVNPDMIPFVLPNVLQIAEQSTEKEFTTHILPDLIPMFKLTAPIQIMLIFLQNMSLLLKKTPASEIKTHVLPMVYRAIESGNPQIQELCLKIIPTFADLVDYTALKNSLVPRIKKLCLSTSTIGVRVNSLLCLGQLLEEMDKWFVLDEVLPLMPQIPSREPAVLMSMLGIYKVALTHAKLGITKDILAGKVIPFLVTLSIDNNLNLKQFNAYMSLIKEMIERVETEHRGKLEQLEQMKQEQKKMMTMEITKITEMDNKTLVTGINDDKPKSMMDDFMSGLGISSMSVSSKPASSVAQKPTATPPTSQHKTLTLEEKQRLAREQEQQRFMKANKPLEMKSAQNKPKQTASSKPVDLTASLMKSNMSGLNSSAGSKPAPNYTLTGAQGGNTGMVSSMTSQYSSGSSVTPHTSTMGSMNSNFGMGMSSSSAMNNSSGYSSTAFPQGGMSQQNKKMDMSSFDSLLPGSSPGPKTSLNRMPQGRSSPMQQQSSMGNMNPQQSMMGNVNSQHSMMGNMNSQQSMMGNANSQGMMGQQQGMMGNSQGMFGQGIMGNKGMMGQQQGVMGNIGTMGNSGMMNSGFGGPGAMNTGFSGMGGQTMNSSGFGQAGVTSQGSMFPGQSMAGQNMMQPMMNQNASSNGQVSARNDLDDLFG